MSLGWIFIPSTPGTLCGNPLDFLEPGSQHAEATEAFLKGSLLAPGS